jgi:hypothetical protein
MRQLSPPSAIAFNIFASAQNTFTSFIIRVLAGARDQGLAAVRTLGGGNGRLHCAPTSIYAAAIFTEMMPVDATDRKRGQEQ